MLRYKIVASDLDGTLMRQDMSVSDENFSAIKRLDESGVFFVPSSGRTLAEIPSFLKENPNIRYIIYSNGASVIDLKTNERISLCMTKNTITKILSVQDRFGCHVTVRANDNSYADSNEQSEQTRAYYNVCDSHTRLLDECACFVDGLTDFMRSLTSVESIAVFFHSKEELNAFAEELRCIPDILFAKGSEFHIEIFSSESGKGNCLIKLCSMLGIDIEETIAVGDSMNDASILKTAGLGLAVANAAEELKSVADAVICDNEHHAIDCIFKKYIEG